MLVIILVSLLGSEPLSLAADARAPAIQQVAIATLTGTSPSTQARRAAAQERAPTDPQTEIINRIAGRNLSWRAVSAYASKSKDMQSAIVRSITGQH